MAQQKNKKIGCTGNLESQIIVDSFDSTKRRIKIVKDLQEVKLRDILASISKKMVVGDPEMPMRLLDLYYLYSDGEMVDITTPEHARLANAFATGYLIAKFLSKTNSRVVVDQVNIPQK